MSITCGMAVFIGRLEPLHLGHCYVIKQALECADYVCILIGSSFMPRSYRNPWTFEERKQMILESFPEFKSRIIVLPLEDSIYNDARWVQNVQSLVSEALISCFGSSVLYDGRYPNITLIGHNKDNSSYYLELFPQWTSINVPGYESEEFVLSATQIRNWYFSRDSDYFLKVEARHLSEATRTFLSQFNKTSAYADICEEYEFIREYKRSWESSPYPPTFVTVDAVVVQSGHILLIKRKARPGKGLWALPGGFLNQYERIEDAIIRELREETKIKVPAPVLRGSIVATKVFDDPYRSSRGRTITHAALLNLAPSANLPQVKGGDDAQFAKFFPISSVTREMMFEDHYDVILNLVAMI